MTILRHLLALLSIVCVALPLDLAAQAADAVLLGTITDSSGAVIPGVNVHATSRLTRLVRKTVSNGAGLFRLVLPGGDYDVVVSLPGFGTVEQQAVVVGIGEHSTLDVVLAPAAREEAITVAAERPVLELSRSSLASAIGARAVADLPVNGRSFIDFVLLTPGVARDTRKGELSFGGLRGTLNNLQIDGVDNNHTFTGETLGRTGVRAPYQFSQDSIQEFQVNASTYQAEFGRAGGAVINVITKSGTNDLHGAAFEFFRDKALNANDFFNNAGGIRKPPYHTHQFGANAGGPLVRDRAFFFGNFDGQRQRLPTIVIPGGPGFIVPSDPASQQAFAALEPYTAAYDRTSNQNVYLAKVDWNLEASHRLSARFNSQRFTGGNLENPGQTNSLDTTGDSLVSTDTAMVGFDSVLGPRSMNQARIQVARDEEPGFANGVDPRADIREAGRAVLLIGRNAFNPRVVRIERTQLIDTFSILVGRHQLKTGIDVNLDRIRSVFPAQAGGSYSFTTLAQFATGRPQEYFQSFFGPGDEGAITYPHVTELATFVQDEWRVGSRLTVNLGLRYDLEDLADPPTANPHPALRALGLATDRFNLDTNNLAPRAGLAWHPMSNVVVRGGYGMYYGCTPANPAAIAHSLNGIDGILMRFTGADVPVYPQKFDAPPTNTQAKPSVLVFAPDFVNPLVHQTSVDLEYNVVGNLTVGASYLMVQGRHMPRTRNVNLLPPVPAEIEVLGSGPAVYERFPGRLFPDFDRISVFESAASTTYHGLTLRAQRRFSGNLQLLASYTYSRATDDVTDINSTIPFIPNDDSRQGHHPLDPQADRGPSMVDVPHRFSASGVWDFGTRRMSNAFARILLSGWSLSGIFSGQGSPPYSPLVDRDLNNDGNSRNDRPPGVGRNSSRGFAYASLDARIARSVALGGPRRLELIAETFNLLNRTNFRTISAFGSLPSLNATAFVLRNNRLEPRADFGLPRETFDPRIVQLAARVTF